jgi:hypothetical protein
MFSTLWVMRCWKSWPCRQSGLFGLGGSVTCALLAGRRARRRDPSFFGGL